MRSGNNHIQAHIKWPWGNDYTPVSIICWTTLTSAWVDTAAADMRDYPGLSPTIRGLENRRDILFNSLAQAEISEP
ncbi:MAG: hypothetical protein ACREUR_06835 [Nitrosospira sp.]